MTGTVPWLWVALSGLGGCCLGAGLILFLVLLLALLSLRRQPPWMMDYRRGGDGAVEQ